MAYAQSEQEPRQGPALGHLDVRHDLVRQHRAHAVQLQKLLSGEGEQVGRVLHQALVHEHVGPLLAEAVDIHGAAADEVGEPAEDLRGAGGVHAVAHRLALRPHHLAAADRAALGHDEPTLLAGALAHNRPHDLGDDVARPLHDHRIADTDVLAADVVLVVEGRLLDDDTAYLHGLQHGKGVEAAGAAHVDRDLQKLGRRLDGRELVGDRPARLPPYVAQSLLEVQAVELHNQAVDLVLQAVTLLRPLLVAALDILQVAATVDVGIDAKAELIQPLERLPVGVRRLSIVRPAELVDPDVQPPGSGDAGV